MVQPVNDITYGVSSGAWSSMSACTACTVACIAEQHPGGRTRAMAAQPWNTLDSSTDTIRTTWINQRRCINRSPACIVRTRLASQGVPVGATSRMMKGMNSAALQPVHRHSVLRQQLPYKVRRYNYLELHHRRRHLRGALEGSDER